MYEIGFVKDCPAYGTYICLGCNREVEKLKKIDTGMWRCIECAAVISNPQQYDPVKQRQYSPLAADLVNASLGLPVPVRREVSETVDRALFTDEEPSQDELDQSMAELRRLFAKAASTLSG